MDGTAQGVLVFDGSIPNLRLGRVLRAPVICTVVRGNIAQLAIGLNPAIPTLTGVWAQDHGAFGTVHIGIGTSANLGGVTKAATHLDGMMNRPTLRLDGEAILEDGRLII